MVSGGPQLVTRLGRLGEVELSAAMSGDDGAFGHAWSAAYVYVARGFTVGGAVRRASASYATAGNRTFTADPLALDAGVSLSLPLWSVAHVSGTWQRQEYHGPRPVSDSVSVTSRVRVSRRTDAFITVSRTRVGGVDGPSVYAGLNRTVGRRGAVGASVQQADGRTTAGVDVQRSMPVGEGYGYRVRAEAGGSDVVDGNLQYQSRRGRYELRQTQNGSAAGTSLSVSGALVGIGGRVYAARPVEQSFALVRVPGVSRVRAYVSNQEIGRTDRHGNLLVPNLLPYYGNTLRIADEDVPLALTIGTREMTLAPPFRGGAVALFPVAREQRVTGTVRLVRQAVTEVPVFGRVVVRLAGQEIESPIGRNGAFYLEKLPVGPVTAIVEYEGQSCAFELTVPVSDAPVAALGAFACEVP
jgi:outer membrane usher protein